MRLLPSGRLGLLVILVCVAALTLAGCGSRVDADTVARANGVSTGTAGSGTEGTVDGGLGAVDTGTDTGAGTVAGDDSGVVGDSGTVPGTTTGGGTTGGPAAPEGDGDNAPEGGGEAGACDGFKNQTGITNDKIVIANSSDISGPVPGLMQAGQDATRAYAAYFNATSDLCGRKLEVLLLDSRTDAAADQ
ncbi:MAG: hypothetical protein Q7J48_13345, partial [Nocardioides sp.]|nr:hypothetical protein [Nocardioides sp.]